jgi:hypothetical protein
MIAAMPGESARLLAAAIVTGWGLLAICMGSMIWTNFGGVADFGARMAKMGRGIERTHRQNTIRAYRRHGGIWVALGSGAVLFGLIGFLWAVT